MIDSPHSMLPFKNSSLNGVPHANSSKAMEDEKPSAHMYNSIDSANGL